MPQNADGNWPGLRKEVLTLLRCLTCQSLLEQKADGLVCGCGRHYPSFKGVVRFVDAENYADSFSFQWKLHARTQLDDATSKRSENAFRRRTGFRPEDLAG